jgi:hypothetical protein
MRNRTERLSDLLDWKNLAVVGCLLANPLTHIDNLQFYREARHKSLEKIYPDRVAQIAQEVGLFDDDDWFIREAPYILESIG